MSIEKKKYVLISGAFAFVCNFILFMLKLYVGLSSNSISIYSDGINNLFDSLSGAITVAVFCALLKTDDTKEIVAKRSGQLLSFVMSAAVAFSGVYFAYSSLERLMYPTPVWYMEKYLVVIVATTLVKLAMFFVFRYLNNKTESPVTKVMVVDGILDFFVSAITAFTLVISQYGNYAFDALLGIAVSVVIISGAVKLTISSVKELIFN